MRRLALFCGGGLVCTGDASSVDAETLVGGSSRFLGERFVLLMRAARSFAQSARSLAHAARSFVHAARSHYGGGEWVASTISVFVNVTLALCVFACFQMFSLGFKLTHQPQERFVSKVFETSQAVLREGLKTPTLEEISTRQDPVL